MTCIFSVSLISFLIIFKVSFITSLNPQEEFDFIKLISIWRKGQLLHLEDCLFYNFGYDKELPYPKIDLNLETDIDITINANGMETPTSCSVVLIAGKYAGLVNDVMKRMDDIAEQTQAVPLGAFIFEEFLTKIDPIDNSIRNDYSPTMVKHYQNI